LRSLQEMIYLSRKVKLSPDYDRIGGKRNGRQEK